VACGFGTGIRGIEKIGINGNHAVLITGLGLWGLPRCTSRKLGAQKDLSGSMSSMSGWKLATGSESLRRIRLVSGRRTPPQIKQLTGGLCGRGAIGVLLPMQAARAMAVRANPQVGKDCFHRRRLEPVNPSRI